MCVEKCMVSGKRQAIDRAFIKVNASLNSLIEKAVPGDAVDYTDELNENSEFNVASQKKKQVGQHHAWRQRTRKDIPGYNYKDGKSGEALKSTRKKYSDYESKCYRSSKSVCKNCSL